MGRRLNWDRAKKRKAGEPIREDRPKMPRNWSGGAAGPAVPIDPASVQTQPGASTKFQLTYARYASAELARGRKPLPPIQWIAHLKENAARRQKPPT